MVRSIAEAARALRTGSTTAVGLLSEHFARAERVDEDLGVFLARFEESAFEAAERADEAFRRGDRLGPLHGIPVGIKDIIVTSEAEVTAQSLAPVPHMDGFGEAPIVTRLREAGAVIVGKTSIMEFAIGAPDLNTAFPVPRNPFNRERWAGGSSSGSASGVAAGLFLGSLGTDTAGSVRLPAAWCGVTGFKPTFGVVPKSRIVPCGHSFDTVGPLARSAADCALLLNAIAGHGSDRTASNPEALRWPYVGRPAGELDGLRIGVVTSVLERDDCDPDVAALTRDAIDVFVRAGAQISEVELPLYDEIVLATYGGALAEGFAFHAQNLRDHWADYGPEVRIELARGALLSGNDYLQAQRVRSVARASSRKLFDSVDIVLSPTVLVAAPPIEGLTLGMLAEVLLTGYWNGLGNPAVSIPMGLTSDALPAGLQLVGRPLADAEVLATAEAFQRLTAHHLVVPALIEETK